MPAFSPDEILYLRIRNAVRRALGIAATLAGGALIVRRLLSDPAELGADERWLLAGGVCLACGAIGLLARSYRPDLGDQSWLERWSAPSATAPYRGRRTWWTGDPLDRSEEQGVLTPRTSDSGG